MTGVLQPMSHKFTSVCGWNSGASANLHQRSVSPKLCHGQKATNHCRSGCCATTQRKDNGWSWDLTTKTKMVNGCFLGTRPFESFRSSEPLWMDDQSSYCWVIHGQGGAFPQDLRKRSKFKRSTGVLQPTSHKFTSVCGWNSGANANLHQQSVSPKLCGKILATSVQLMHICFFRRRHATWKSEKSNEIFWDMSDMWLPMFHRIGWWENWNRKARSIWW